MSRSSLSPRRHPVLWIGSALLAVALGVGIWLATRPTPAPSPANAGKPPEQTTATNQGAAGSRSAGQSAGGRAARPTAPLDTGEASAAVAAIIGDSEIDDTTARNRLLGLVTDATRPVSERAEALEHVLLLTPDTDSAALLPLVSSARLPAEIRERLIEDTHNRSGKTQLDLFLALLERADGEQTDEIIEVLRTLTGEDHGADLAAWRVAVESHPTPTP